MKQLQDILYKVPILEMKGDTSIGVNDFHFDSRRIVPGALFVAISGTQVNGHDFIQKAIDEGAIAIVCETLPDKTAMDVTYVKVKNSTVALAHIAANYYENPADELQIIGITGTNGKTTTATLLHDLFTALGVVSGLLSTVCVKIGTNVFPATHTTPDAKALHRTFRKMLNAGCTICFMEVSSHALHQQRVAGISFAGAIFTNITHDHLDYHQTFPEYIRAKKTLFDQLPKHAFALTNLDDKNGKVMLQNSAAFHKSYSLKRMSDFRGKVLENTFEGMQMEVNNQQVWFRMVGSFNAYNLLSVYATAILLGQSESDILVELSKIEGVDGRFQVVHPPDHQFVAIVDYAHTPDALENVLKTIHDILGDGGKVITVVGCGGNRDKVKRPEMGKIAAENSNQSIFTSDNPRNENPATIIEEMISGVPVSMKKKVLTVENRKEAIAVACKLADKNDIVLVAGKGHETYQEVKGEKIPFDDREILKETFQTMSS